MLTFRSTLENIYDYSESDDEAANSIYFFLNHHRWDNGRYFFAYDAASYINRAYGSERAQVGTNGYNKKDADGGYVIRGVVEAAKNSEVGFHQYRYLNPASQKIEDKITASFYFKPLDLVVATGDYVSSLKQTYLNAVLTTITVARYGKDGYFWIQDAQG
jgi:methyl-accepting chemotaxis protein